MTSSSPIAQSVQARLVRRARELEVDPNLLLTRYAAERLLYRLSRSQHAGRFVLKGAMLLVVWLGEMIRPTRDIDLLGFGDLTDEALAATFAEIATIEVEPDGVVFDPASIEVVRIREEDAYGGRRITVRGSLGPARLRVQIDVGIGDALVPAPQSIEYPSLLDLPRPKLKGYSPETAIAEKLHAMVVLGTKNSRMRDFFDVRALAQHEPFDGERLAAAIRSTFERRATPIPTRPAALTRTFATAEGKAVQWEAFLSKNGLPHKDFASVIDDLGAFLLPVLVSIGNEGVFRKVWPPEGPWS